MTRSFRSVFLVASCAGAALSCYLVSLRVASERAALEQVETRIVHAQRDIRLLQTEIGTRARLAQLERWNVRVLALSAPSADQFVEGGFALARLVKPERAPALEAPVVFASAPAPQPQHAPLEEGGRRDGGAGASTAAGLLREASLKREVGRPLTGSPAKLATAAPKPVTASSKPATAASKPAGAAPKPDTVRSPQRTAKVDPLAPLPAGSGKPATARDPGPAR